MKRDPRVDAYIAKAAAFAQPLLVEMRKRAQQACPERSSASLLIAYRYRVSAG